MQVQYGAFSGSDEALLEFLGSVIQHRRCGQHMGPEILRNSRQIKLW